MASIRVGISGWRYPPWRGTFYPEDLPQSRELHYASRNVSTIEINGSFYSLQRPSSYAAWYADTPEDFIFTVKGPRYITHMLRLRNVEEPLANFLASGVFNLQEKLGPILWQFPPNFKYQPEQMAAFLQLLPKDYKAARAIASKHSSWMKGRTKFPPNDARVLRHAVEIRNESFLDRSFITLLRDQKVALVIAESARQWPMPQDITSDFVYMRLHGDEELYRSGYKDAALTRWARRIRAWHRGAEPRDAKRVASNLKPGARPRDVYCYFDNTDVKLRAPHDARSLMRKLRLVSSKQ